MRGYSDAIALLPAGIKQEPSGKWVSTDLSEADDKLGAPGGKLRILAATLLLKKNPKAFIITGGGKGRDISAGFSGTRPLLAEILRDELIAEGISLDRIKLEWNSNSTYQELIEIEHITQELDVRELTLVTNLYSLPRLQSMIEVKFPYLRAHQALRIVAAEDVLVKDDPHIWQEKIEEEYRSEYLKRRAEKEQKGVEEIHADTYRFF